MDKNQKILVIVIAILAVVSIASVAYVFLFNNNPAVNIAYINSENGADVRENTVLNSKIVVNEANGSKLSNEVIEAAKNGTPVVQFGNGEGPVSVVITGVHGNQLPSQVGALALIDYLKDKKIKGTVYVIPFAVPEATAKNEKYSDGENLNKVADKIGTPSNDIITFVISKNATVVGDFHSTAPGAVPGHDVIMCSQYPTYDSYLLAIDMCRILKENIEIHTIAGLDYNGAIEDVLNQRGTPSITGLSTSPHGEIAPGSAENSFNQMLSMLKVNGNIE